MSEIAVMPRETIPAYTILLRGRKFPILSEIWTRFIILNDCRHTSAIARLESTFRTCLRADPTGSVQEVLLALDGLFSVGTQPIDKVFKMREEKRLFDSLSHLINHWLHRFPSSLQRRAKETVDKLDVNEVGFQNLCSPSPGHMTDLQEREDSTDDDARCCYYCRDCGYVKQLRVSPRRHFHGLCPVFGWFEALSQFGWCLSESMIPTLILSLENGPIQSG